MPQVLQRNNTLSQLSPMCLSSITGPTIHPFQTKKRSASFLDVLNISTTGNIKTPPLSRTSSIDENSPLCNKCENKRRKIASSSKSAQNRYSFPAFLSNEASFPSWYLQVQKLISKRFPGYVVLDLIPTQPVEDETYLQKLDRAHTLCAQNEYINQELNHILFEYVDEKWTQYLTTDLASENFETLKHIFQSKITAKYLIELESNLKFDKDDVPQFLSNIELLSQVYFIVFREIPNRNVKTQWAMQALLKNVEKNKQIIAEINKEGVQSCEQCIFSILKGAHRVI
ncbi:hypothetical protein CLIB1423_16S00892 [[Candida] railenensis]|uniref:Uncharacterized protein n=1 Tax=[Candida] railenensis TaxID=45579 RepID=A0A9P0W086_9ASCO|nr:hypothetical protein CLIB1423_16S00892 [[Candida] railenensis]